MHCLGYAYEFGVGGLPEDVAQAVHWHRKAADAGSASSMYFLGHAYHTGRVGLPQDDSQAVQWYRKAAVADADLRFLLMGANDEMKTLGL
jgi:hypothetical protein